MSNRSARRISAGSAILRCLAASERRLAGRWDDPAAWKVLCEELAVSWRGDADVSWVLVLARNGFGPVYGEVDRSAAALIWIKADGQPRWLEPAVDRGFWSSLASAPGGVLNGQGAPPFDHGGSYGAGLGAGRWLACSLRGPNGPEVALILGCSLSGTDEDTAGRDAAERLAAGLLAARAQLEPLMGLHRHAAGLSAAVAASRSECEALSRLGELRSRLAAVTAHELKTPLTSIMAYSEALENQAGNPEFEHTLEFLGVIRDEADRLLRLVDSLLDSSRRGRGPVLADPRPVQVGSVCQEVRRIMAPQAAAKDQCLGITVPDNLPPLEGDVDLVRQILLNLLGNATKFTPAGGRIVVSAREDASTVRLTVSDNGPGIAPDELRAIFQCFYRARSVSQTEGVGLGLSIVKDIVHLHGGHCDVQSRPGKGSVFSVHLPKQQRFWMLETALAASGVDSGVLRRLAGDTLRLVSELISARGTALLLPAALPGKLVVAAESGLGLDTDAVMVASDHGLMQRASRQMLLIHGGDGLPSALARFVDQPGGAMLSPMRVDGRETGALVLAARRSGGGAFGTDDMLLLRVLSEILDRAWSAVLDSGATKSSRDMMTDALVALSGMRRSGIPTADPLALRILSRTGQRLGQSAFEVRLLQYACALHDAGMLLMDPEVLHKPAELDFDERDHIGHHPQRALDLLGPLVALPGLQAVIRHHHERVDGKGYPQGRRGSEIPLGSRILAVVDAFFAMIRSRPWREGLPVAGAVSEIQRHAGSQFDADVVAAFLSTLHEEGLLAPQGLDGAARR